MHTYVPPFTTYIGFLFAMPTMTHALAPSTSYYLHAHASTTCSIQSNYDYYD